MTSAGTVPFRYLAEWYRPEVMEQSVDDICAALDAGTAVLCAEGTPVRLR